MSETVVTRIRLPGEVHRQVKAQAAYHGVNLDQALGMCVAFVCGLTTPLSWVKGLEACLIDINEAIECDKTKF